MRSLYFFENTRLLGIGKSVLSTIEYFFCISYKPLKFTSYEPLVGVKTRPKSWIRQCYKKKVLFFVFFFSIFIMQPNLPRRAWNVLFQYIKYFQKSTKTSISNWFWFFLNPFILFCLVLFDKKVKKYKLSILKIVQR